MNDLSSCTEKFGHFSEDPAKFSEEFNLTWGDLQILLSHCCTAGEKARILNAVRQYANEVAAHNQGHATYHTGGERTQMGTDPQWNYQRGPEDLDERNHDNLFN